jgi:hypothetical protein
LAYLGRNEVPQNVRERRILGYGGGNEEARAAELQLLLMSAQEAAVASDRPATRRALVRALALLEDLDVPTGEDV